MALPQQEHHNDSGLLLLCFAKFFCDAQPRELVYEVINGLHSNSKAAVDQALEVLQEAVGNKDHKGFLSLTWFKIADVNLLRDHIKILIFDLMLKRMEAPQPPAALAGSHARV
ncbi:hypothetical protein FOA52_001962 [Chlamydomonas sp. UWO 241]|nr:hypothetical protein FOA52_001962 [Chlamydomonas sp. UWO 241]